VIYISHRLDEIFRIADRVTVIRDGQHISTKPIAEVTEDGMVRDMVGRALESFAVKTAANPHGEAMLSVRDLGLRACSAASTSTCTRARSSASPVWSARGAPMSPSRSSASPPRPRARSRSRATARIIRSPQQAMDLGLAYVSEDRRKLGLALPLSDLRQHLAGLLGKS
jgi:ABC-type sugar transport system ATPase subunit